MPEANSSRQNDHAGPHGEPPGRRSGIVKRIIRVAIDVGTTWWLLDNDEAPTNTVEAVVIVLLKAARAVL